MTAASKYKTLLLDPRWQRKRLETLERAHWACDECRDTTATLHVHHKIYRRGAAPWEYADHELVALCEFCHEARRHFDERLRLGLGSLDRHDRERVLGYIEASLALKDSPGGSLLELKVEGMDYATGVSDAIGGSGADVCDVVDELCDRDDVIKREALLEYQRRRMAKWQEQA